MMLIKCMRDNITQGYNQYTDALNLLVSSLLASFYLITIAKNVGVKVKCLISKPEPCF